MIEYKTGQSGPTCLHTQYHTQSNTEKLTVYNRQSSQQWKLRIA